MENNQSPFRFDHKEMSVIFSLFIFTSLLMFTVGIMVGKGISQSKSEPSAEVATVHSRSAESREPASGHSAAQAPGTSVTTDSPSEIHPSHSSEATKPQLSSTAPIITETTKTELTPIITETPKPELTPAAPINPSTTKTELSHTPSHSLKSKTSAPRPSHLSSVTDEVSEPAPGAVATVSKPIISKIKEDEDTETFATNTIETPELELIPERPKTGDVRAGLADLADLNEVEVTLKKPQINSLLEVPAKLKAIKRAISSVAIPTTPPKSFPEGKFTVQVGSYPSQADATLRMDQLRKLGFPFAYTSIKQLGEKNEPWYRVWLGYFSDTETAKLSGELLQSRGEVKSYLVRKSDTKED